MEGSQRPNGGDIPAGVYVCGTAPGSGKSLVSLGLMDAMHRRADSVGFFRPIVGVKDPNSDPMVALMRSQYKLDPSVCAGGVALASARSPGSGKANDVLAGAVERFSRLRVSADVVVVEGSDFAGNDTAMELAFNARLANNLGLPVLAVVGARGLSLNETVEAISVAGELFDSEHCPLLGVIVNRADPLLVDTLADAPVHGAGVPGLRDP
ncbi:AAA family ATPase [Arthrobacter sp. NyZ413]|uniref:AAA family ATPase n=1 Tax=Arthrobacter sp. NyZ413 TaxID=3144669 RepID=UPI003BF91E8E